MGAPAVAPRRAPARGAPAGRRSDAARRRRAAAARRRRAGSGAARRGRPRPNAPLASGPRGVAQPALAGAALLPHAAVRTAGAVRDLSDSSLIVRLTAGRGWIAVLGLLLSGIVALNVISLSINSTSGRVSQAIDEYERQNSSLRGQLAEQLSAARVEDAAAAMGLAVPSPDDITYLDAKGDDLERLARALGGDNPLATAPLTDTSYPATDGSAATGSYAPSAGAPTAPAPATGTTAPAPAPATSPAPAAPPSSGAGGASSGGIGL